MILRVFKFAPVKPMQYDAKILLVNIQVEEIRDRFAIRAIRAAGPRNPVWKLAGRSKSTEGDLERVFASQTNELY